MATRSRKSDPPGVGAGKPVPAGRRRAPHLGPERRRPLVLDAALRLFVKHGYRGTSMDSIAAAAGVTKPVVYECYAGKEELFRALLEREERRLLEAVGAALPREASVEDVEALLVDGLTALLTAAEAAPDSWRVVFESEHGGEPAIARRVRRSRAAIVAQLVGLVRPVLEGAGVQDAERKAPVLAEVLASVGEAAVRTLLASDGGWRPRELGGLIGRLAFRGPTAI
jgi:AcrR family transcriptional regulator